MIFLPMYNSKAAPSASSGGAAQLWDEDDPAEASRDLVTEAAALTGMFALVP